jgi:hypothetical protein
MPVAHRRHPAEERVREVDTVAARRRQFAVIEPSPPARTTASPPSST